MNSFFEIRRNYSSAALKLSIDYSFDDVPDPHIVNQPGPTPEDFMEHFKLSVSGGTGEDMLMNNAGWVVFSRRVSEVFRALCAPGEIELIPLENNPRVPDRVRGYHLLGVKKRIECVDYEQSDILWDKTESGEKEIAALRRCVIKGGVISRDTNCFMIAEYATFPVISYILAQEIMLLRPTGLVCERLSVSN